MPPARFLARPEPYIAFEANPVAWLNLSQREYASALVSVRTSAITTTSQQSTPQWPPISPHPGPKLTNKRQPNKLKARQRNHSQQNPQHRLRIQRNPKEPLIRRIDHPHSRIRALKHPPTIPRRPIDLVPPAQPDEAPSRDVLEVVEVRG